MNPDEIERAVAALKAQGAPDEAIHAFLQERLGAPADAPPQHDFHAEFKSGALAKRMAGANAREAANLADEEAAQPGYVERLAAHVLNAAQGIPGVEAIEAEAGRQGSTLTDHPVDYRTALQTLRDRTGQIGGKTRMAEKLMGGLATIPFLPASGAKAGAILGAADQALAADPDRGLGERAVRTGVGAGLGALAGRTLEAVGPFVRALRAKSTASNLIDRTAARKASADAMYAASLNANKGHPFSDEAAAFLEHPDVAPIRDRLLSMDLGLKPNSPELFDAIYKVLSDQQKVAQKGLAVAEPGRPNTGRFTLEHLAALKDKFLNATTQPGSRQVLKTQDIEVPMTTTRTVPSPTTAQSPAPDLRDAIKDFHRAKGVAAERVEGTHLQQNHNPFSNQRVELSPGMIRTRDALDRHFTENVVSPSLTGAPGPRELTETTTVPATAFWRERIPAAPPLPGYGEAVQDYARRSADMKAVETGSDALTNAVSAGKVAGKNVVKKSREGFSQFAAGAEPSERQAAVEGILGNLKGSKKLSFGHVLGTAIVPKPSPELSAAPDLLRRALDPVQAKNDLLVKLGLLAGDAATDQTPQ